MGMSLYPYRRKRNFRTAFGKSTTSTAKRRRIMRIPRRRFSYRRRAGRSRNLRTGGFLGIELKFLDCAWNGVALATSTDGSGGELQPSSGCTNCLSVPAQGDGESNRDGRKYTIKSVWCSGMIEYGPAGDQSDAADITGAFLALVLDTQANGATVVSEDVFINPSTTTQAMLPQPLRNLQNSKRFKILASTYIQPHGMYAFNDNAGTTAFTGTIGVQVVPKFSLNWKGNIVCDSIGTTADVASASDNAIHLVGYVGATNFTPNVTCKSRVRFVG